MSNMLLARTNLYSPHFANYQTTILQSPASGKHRTDHLCGGRTPQPLRSGVDPPTERVRRPSVRYRHGNRPAPFTLIVGEPGEPEPLGFLVVLTATNETSASMPFSASTPRKAFSASRVGLGTRRSTAPLPAQSRRSPWAIASVRITIPRWRPTRPIHRSAWKDHSVNFALGLGTKGKHPPASAASLATSVGAAHLPFIGTKLFLILGGPTSHRAPLSDVDGQPRAL